MTTIAAPAPLVTGDFTCAAVFEVRAGCATFVAAVAVVAPVAVIVAMVVVPAAVFVPAAFVDVAALVAPVAAGLPAGLFPLAPLLVPVAVFAAGAVVDSGAPVTPGLAAVTGCFPAVVPVGAAAGTPALAVPGVVAACAVPKGFTACFVLAARRCLVVAA